MTSVDVVAMGGTIAMTPGQDGGVVPALDAGALLEATGDFVDISVETETFRNMPGAHLTIEDAIALARHLHRRGAPRDPGGIVVTQGTDTIEEFAWLLDLVWDSPSPVVVTGAMRHPTQPGADGGANLRDAILVAAAPEARRTGAMVVFAGEVHAARFVRKSHTTHPGAFHSVGAGPIGWVAEDRVRIPLRPVPLSRVPLDSLDGPVPPVGLVTAVLGDDGRQLDTVEGLGYEALVVDAFGAGHVPLTWVERLDQLATKMPVVLTSRTGAGEVFRATYGFAGSERDLLARRLICGGALDGRKARLALSLAMTARWSHERIATAFESWSSA